MMRATSGSWYLMAALAMAVGIVGCGTPDEPLPTSPTGVKSVLPGGEVQLSKGQTVRAIAARSRASRRGKAPSENVMRVYDRFGNVTRESVKQNGKWVDRASTLSRDLASMSLRAFVNTGDAALFDTTLVTSQHLPGWYVVGTDTIVANDSVFTNPTAMLQVRTHDASGYDESVSDLYYPTVASTGTVSAAVAASAVMLLPPGDDTYLEWEFTGTEFTDGMAAAVAAMSGVSLREVQSPAPKAAGAIVTLHDRLSNMEAEKPCQTERDTAKNHLRVQIGIGFIGAVVSFFNPAAIPAASAVYYGFAGFTAVAMLNYHDCIGRHPYNHASFILPDASRSFGGCNTLT